MSVDILNTIALLYFIAILFCLFWSLHQATKTLLFLYFPYPCPSAVVSTSKLRQSQWRRFLLQVSSPGSAKVNELDSDSNNELNAQKKRFTPTTFKEWAKCLCQRYHPIGTLWYVLTAGRKKTLPIATSLSLLAATGYHWVISVLYTLILYATSNEEESAMKFSIWIAVAIPCAAVILGATFAGILLVRRAIKAQVSTVVANAGKLEDKSSSQGVIMKRKDSTAEYFLKNGLGTSKTEIDGVCLPSANKPVQVEKQDLEQPIASLEKVEGDGNRIKFVLFLVTILASISMGFTVSTCSTLSQSAIQDCLLAFAISWGIDLFFLRLVFLSILAFIFSRTSNAVVDCNELQAFELWRIPSEIIPEDSSCDATKPVKPENETQICSLGVSSVLKEWRVNGNTTFEGKPGTSPIHTVEDIKTEQSRSEFVIECGKSAKENRLETVRDDAEGENLASLASPPKKSRNFVANEGTDKENMSVDRKAKMLWGFNDMFSSKQTSPLRSQRPEKTTLSPIRASVANQVEMSFVVREKSPVSPHKKLNALVYCSPLKKSLKPIQQNTPEHLVKTSPKKPKRTFMFEVDPDSASIKKYKANKDTIEDPELKELIANIKDNASVHKSPPKVEGPIFVQENYAELPPKEPENAEEQPKPMNNSVVVIEEPAEVMNSDNEEENIDENDTPKKEDLLFEKPRDPAMQQIRLFGRQSAMSTDNQKLMLESMADMKLKLPQFAEVDKEEVHVVPLMSVLHHNKVKVESKPPKETVLDVSDFDATLEPESEESKKQPPLATILTAEEEEGRTITEGTEKTLSHKSSAREQRAAMATQKARLKKWLRLAESHDKPMEAAKVRELLAKIKQTKKPLRKTEMRDLEMLEALELPYATRNNLPIQRPLSNEKYSSKSSARSKSRGKPQDPGKLNELYMVYSSTRPKRLHSIDLKKRYGTQAQKEELVIEAKKELPPLKAKAFMGAVKKPTEPEEEYKTSELANNKHLVKIDRIIGQCFDKVRKSFNKLKPRQSSKNIDEYGTGGDDSNNGMGRIEHEHKIRPPRRSLSKVDTHILKLAN